MASRTSSASAIRSDAAALRNTHGPSAPFAPAPSSSSLVSVCKSSALASTAPPSPARMALTSAPAFRGPRPVTYLSAYCFHGCAAAAFTSTPHWFTTSTSARWKTEAFSSSVNRSCNGESVSDRASPPDASCAITAGGSRTYRPRDTARRTSGECSRNSPLVATHWPANAATTSSTKCTFMVSTSSGIALA